MTLAEAKTVAGLVVDAGSQATIDPVTTPAGAIIDWRVIARTQGNGFVTHTQVFNLAEAQGVEGRMREVEFR